MIRSSTRSKLPINACLACILTLTGCSSPQTNHQRLIRTTEHIQDPIRLLEARAELETLSPPDPIPQHIINAILPDAPKALALGSPAYQRAMQSAEHIFAQSGIAQIDTSDPFDEREQSTPQTQKQALKLYTQARALRQTGQFDQAIERLTQAAQLDPQSGAIERELADTYILNNEPLLAIQRFQRAIELGDRSPRAMVHLASQSALAGKNSQVIWLTSQALDSQSITNHPMARSIAGILLGNALIESGYYQAGAQTLTDALASFPTQSRDLRWKREIIQVMSMRPSLWIAAGDAWHSIGADQRAQDAYKQALAIVNRPPPALVARRLVALLEQAQPSQAALVLLDHIKQNATDLAAEEHRWTKALAEIEGIDQALAPAIAAISDSSEFTPSTRRSLLSLELDILDPRPAIARLATAGLDANDPELCRVVFDQIENESTRFNLAAAILETNPQIAKSLSAGLVRTLANPLAFIHAHANPTTQAQELLLASLGLSLGRPDLIEHLDSINFTPNKSDDWIAAHLQALAITGKIDSPNNPSAKPMLQWLMHTEELESDHANTLHLNRLKAQTLLAYQRPQLAWDRIHTQTQRPDAQLQDLLLASQIARMLEDTDSTRALLERALELDPYDEHIYDQLLSLQRADPQPQAAQSSRTLVQQLSKARPRSTFLALIRADELASTGMVNASESLLINLNNQYPTREIGYDLLLSIWKTQSTQSKPDALAIGLDWIRNRLNNNPNSTQAILTLAQGYFELDQYEQALSLLKDNYARTGSIQLARAIEQLLAGPLDQPQAANEHLENRLEPLTGLEPTLEYAQHLAKLATDEATAKLLDRLTSNLRKDSTLLPAQRDQLASIIYTLAGSTEERNNQPDILALISLYESHTPELGFNLARLKILLITQLPKFDAAQLILTTRLADKQAQTDENRTFLRGFAIRALLAQDRPHQAIALASQLAIEQSNLKTTLDTQYLIDTFQLLAARGTNSDMIGTIDFFADQAVMGEAVDLLTSQLGTPTRDTPATTPDQQRADLSYLAAVLASGFDRTDQAQSYYQLALSYDPNHAWANNDLGYMLAESGQQIDYAIQLLERAHQALPNNPSVLDSLAWVRYKMGNLEDFMTPPGMGGGRTIQGAISLLTQANELDTESNNATITLHLGDALWRGGYTDQAIDAWRSAQDALKSRLRLISIEPTPNQRLLESLNSELQAVESRLHDAKATGKPSIAPLANETIPTEKNGSD